MVWRRLLQLFLRLIKRVPNLSRKWKALILVIIFINIAVLFVTLCFDKYRPYLGLFYYSFFSNSPISWIAPLMPQEPALLLYGSFCSPLLVALTAGLATYIIEIFNYQMLVPVCRLELLEQYKSKRFYKVLARYYNIVPFIVVVIVGLTPVPHFPFRVLSVLTGYSIIRYGIATFIGRTLFYYPVALTGDVLNLPYWVYIALLLVIIALGLGFKVVRSYRNRKKLETGTARATITGAQ